MKTKNRTRKIELCEGVTLETIEEPLTDEKTSQENCKVSEVNHLSSTEERLAWCEQYIKILLSHKDDTLNRLFNVEKEVREHIYTWSNHPDKEDAD